MAQPKSPTNNYESSTSPSTSNLASRATQASGALKANVPSMSTIENEVGEVAQHWKSDVEGYLDSAKGTFSGFTGFISKKPMVAFGIAVGAGLIGSMILTKTASKGSTKAAKNA